MIAVDFEYVPAESLKTAVEAYAAFTGNGKNALYYAGGTEIITLARLHQLSPDAVIDIKPIPASQVIGTRNGSLILGSGVTLSRLTDTLSMDLAFPLLCATVNEIADRTARNKITLGGNICGRIFYREAVLPFLVANSLVRTFGPKGGRERSIHKVFQREARLEEGEFIVQLVTDDAARAAPFVHVKRRKAGNVGYPIVSAAAIRLDGRIRVALSGVCPFPFRSPTMEAALQSAGVDRQQRINQAIQVIPPALILDDYEASRGYRVFVLRTILEEILHRLGDG